MKQFTLSSPVVEIKLQGGQSVYKAPLFQKISVFGNAASEDCLSSRMSEVMENLDERSYHLKATAHNCFKDSVCIELKGIKGLPESASIELRFDYVYWQANKSYTVAFVPSLEINVIATSRDKLKPMIDDQIRRALTRKDHLSNLANLLPYDRIDSISSSAASFSFQKLTKEEERKKEEQAQELENSVLKKFVDRLYPSHGFLFFNGQAILQQAVNSLKSRRPKSILLIGSPGTGKTAMVHELIRKKSDLGLSEFEFWETTGARIVAGMTGFGDWQERCMKLTKQAAKRNAIVYLGNLFELIQVGTYEGQSQSIAEFLANHVRKGKFLSILECTEEQYSLIERQNARVAQSFEIIRLSPPSREELAPILKAWWKEKTLSASPNSEIIDTAISLHQQYASYSSSPGREVYFLSRLLDNLQNDEAKSLRSLQTPRDRDAFFASIPKRKAIELYQEQSGLPDFLLSNDSTFDWESASHWFRQRIMGQSDAVQSVVDTLTNMRAGMNRADKPIANLLFAGPTGVGKTQLARSLAEYLFGDEERLLRFDMSEYQNPQSVQRLVGTATRKTGVLTSRIREQPFSVVLFDEFEKAHPDFFDLLLQICGEGRLTDALGRVASFNACVIIMTSNLGAEKAARGSVGFGNMPDQGVDLDTFIAAVRDHLRPEIFNRIDKVIPFESLNKEQIESIAQMELDALLKRDGVLSRNIQLQFEPSLKTTLAEQGFDIRYGARPLKRAIAKRLLAPLADILNTSKRGNDYRITVAAAEGDAPISLKLEKTDAADHAKKGSVARTVDASTELRRKSQTIVQSSFYQQISNKLFILDRRKLQEHPQDETLRNRYQSIQSEVENLHQEILSREEAVLFKYYRDKSIPKEAHSTLEGLQSKQRSLLEKLHAFPYDKPNRATIAIYSKSDSDRIQLLELYANIAKQIPEAKTKLATLLLDPEIDESGKPDLNDIDLAKSGKNKKQILRWETRSQKELIVEPQSRPIEELVIDDSLHSDPCLIGLAIEISMPYAWPFFKGEFGFVELVRDQKSSLAKIESSMCSLASYTPREEGRFSTSYYKFFPGKAEERANITLNYDKRQIALHSGHLHRSSEKAIWKTSTTHLSEDYRKLLEESYAARLEEFIR
ncbi:MAG: AAA family ATPase [Verrucomicrobiota bacterium]